MIDPNQHGGVDTVLLSILAASIALVSYAAHAKLVRGVEQRWRDLDDESRRAPTDHAAPSATQGDPAFCELESAVGHPLVLPEGVACD